MELIKDNYLYGTGHGDTWSVNIDPPKRKVRTYYEETVEAVEYVHANKTGKFQVLYSGGLDSQYVCEVLLRLGMDFDPVVIELHGEDGIYNEHDIKYAYDFCESHNLKPIRYDLDFDHFYKSGKIVEIAEATTCCTLAIPATMHVISQLDGFTLMGNDPPYLRFDNKRGWLLEEMEYIHSLLRFYDKFQMNGCPFLLSYTPEMMLSFLIDPAIYNLGTGSYPGKTGSNSTKSMVFNNGSDFNIPSYDFVSKTRIKYNGYENIFRTERMNHPNLKIFEEFQKQWNGEYLEPYLDAVNRLSINQHRA